MKSVLVTGAGGYIGRHVIPKLAERNMRVIAVDRFAQNGIPNNAVDKYIASDIFSELFDIANEVGEVPDICLHLAWRDGFSHGKMSHLEDLPKHCIFLSKLADAGVQQIAVMGSMHEVGYWEGAITDDTPCNPMSNYGIAKDALRKYAMLLENNYEGLVIQWLRGFYVYGDDAASQSIFGKLIRAAEAGEKTFPFTTGKNKFDFLDVDTLATQIAAAISQTDVSGIINCCSGTPVSLADKIESFISDNKLDISLDYGKYPDRPYDSPGTWGDSTKIDKIMKSAN